MNTITKSPCPVCFTEIEFTWETTDIPHFGEAMLIAGTCSNCGLKHTDTILLSSKEPCRYVLEVESLEDLDARVIRSCSGTIRIPELGVDVEPGAASESYVTNVEGVLDRIEGIVEFVTRTAREAGAMDKALHGEEILDEVVRADVDRDERDLTCMRFQEGNRCVELGSGRVVARRTLARDHRDARP